MCSENATQEPPFSRQAEIMRSASCSTDSSLENSPAALRTALAANDTKTFTCFKHLPVEIRVKIWRLAMPQVKAMRVITIEQVTVPITVYGQSTVESQIKLHRSGDALPSAMLACVEAMTNSEFLTMTISGTTERMIVNPQYDLLRIKLREMSQSFLLSSLVHPGLLNRFERIELAGNWTDRRFHQLAADNLNLLPSMKVLDITAHGFVGPEHRAPPNLNFRLEDDASDIDSKVVQPDLEEFEEHEANYRFRIRSGTKDLYDHRALRVLLDRVNEPVEQVRICDSLALARFLSRNVPHLPDTLWVRFDYTSHIMQHVGGGHFMLVERKPDYDFDDVYDGLTSPNFASHERTV